MRNEALGSAHMAEVRGHEKEKIYNGYNIGFGRGFHGGYHGQSISKHFLTVASNRSGKGTALIIPNLLTYEGSAIVIDPKGENAWITAPARRAMGQKTYILDPWGEVNRRYGSKAGQKEAIARFNPLSILDPKDPSYSDDLAYIADALIINQSKEPHWDDSARELIAGLCSFVVEKFGKAASLRMVRGMLTQPSEYIADIASKAQLFDMKSQSRRKLARFMVSTNELNNIISTALTQTAFLDNDALLNNLDESSFNFDDLATVRPATIYLVLPVDKLKTHGRWLRLMVSLGIRALSRNTAKLALPVLFVLDEFGTIGKLSAISQAVGLMAGLQMCVWIFVQDFVQLKRDYGDEWETFVANAQAVMFFGVMDQFTAEYLSKAIGNTTVERISQTTAEERENSDNPHYMRMADQIFSRRLITPDEIRSSHIQFVIRAGFKGVLPVEKINYYKDAFFQKKARRDPFFTYVPAVEVKEKPSLPETMAGNKSNDPRDNFTGITKVVGSFFGLPFIKAAFIVFWLRVVFVWCVFMFVMNFLDKYSPKEYENNLFWFCALFHLFGVIYIFYRLNNPPKRYS